MEVGENKTQYEGTLDQLYNKDFKKFIEYNRQDTFLLYKIHAKLKFLDLANQLAHQNTVVLQTVMGSVAIIEQAIMNEAHIRGVVVPDKIRRERKNDEDIKQAAGAYVANPQKGIHEWIGACDITSLYPSVIRALNLAPETIVGQVRQTLTDKYMEGRGRVLNMGKRQREAQEDDVEGNLLWDGLFGSLEYTAIMNCERGTMITIDYENGTSEEMSAAEAWKMIFDSHNPWILTANGTIFTYEVEGVIPGLLTKWFSERKELQKKLKEISSLVDGIMISDDLSEKLAALLK
jgi:DNA polymerase elongation subunit (family B)